MLTAPDCFEKKAFAENRQFHVLVDLEAVKHHLEARNGKFGSIMSRIESYFMFYSFLSG